MGGKRDELTIWTDLKGIEKGHAKKIGSCLADTSVGPSGSKSIDRTVIYWFGGWVVRRVHLKSLTDQVPSS